MTDKCHCCGYEGYSGSGGYNSIHFNYTDIHNLKAVTSRGDFEKHIAELFKEDIYEEQLDETLYCIWLHLKNNFDYIGIQKEFHEIFFLQHSDMINAAHEKKVKDIIENINKELQVYRWRIDECKNKL